MGPSSDSCTACVGSGLHCELAFSEAKLRRIQKKRREKLSSLAEAAAKIARLKNEIDKLEREEEELVRRELQNIEELEADEAAQVPAEPLFNLDSETFEVPPGFDWSVFAPVETVAEGSGSSQGS